MISKIRTLATILLSHLLHSLSYLVPRNKNTWVFIGWRRNDERQIFADNAKYLFLAAHERPDIRAIWIAEDETLAQILKAHGYESYTQTSLLGILHALRAGTTCIDANFQRHNWQWAGGSRIVQLWHGKGFKVTGHENKRRATQHRFFFPELYVRYAYTIATSPYTAEMMSKTMRVPKERVLITGLPREDVLFKAVQGSEIDSHPELDDFFKNHTGKTILYAPTFRRWENNPLDHLDCARLQEYLEQANAEFVLSLHPKYRSAQIRIGEFKNIHFISPGYDLQPYMASFDTIISDYGNIFLEFLLLDKHMIFYTYDIDRYRKESGLYDDYDTLTPGPHVKNMEELLQVLEVKDQYTDARAKARSTLYSHQNGDSSTRIISALLEN